LVPFSRTGEDGVQYYTLSSSIMTNDIFTSYNTHMDAPSIFISHDWGQ
jgi:hypothetical protein